jgi:hypothetical protein
VEDLVSEFALSFPVLLDERSMFNVVSHLFMPTSFFIDEQYPDIVLEAAMKWISARLDRKGAN